MSAPHDPFKLFDYRAIVDAPKIRWPKDARVAVWVIPNVEHFHLEIGNPAPDVRNYSRRDYGNRVGVFRMMETMDRYGARGTVALNSDLCRMHPEIIEECMARKWELMGHNESNTRRLNEIPPEEEKGVIARTIAEIERASGVRP